MYVFTHPIDNCIAFFEGLIQETMIGKKARLLSRFSFIFFENRGSQITKLAEESSGNVNDPNGIFFVKKVRD